MRGSLDYMQKGRRSLRRSDSQSAILVTFPELIGSAIDYIPSCWRRSACSEANWGEPKLLDFGIAKILDLANDTTTTSMRMLTPDYASPEQVTGGRVSTATDIYCLGAVFYELLTGRAPHKFEEHEAIASLILAREVIRPSQWAPELKGDVEAILLKAMRKDPPERYATVDLEAFLAMRPVRARAGNTWYRTRKLVRRYWVPVGAAALVLVSLLGWPLRGESGTPRGAGAIRAAPPAVQQSI